MKKWSEKSVWSLVCAQDLGLVVEPIDLTWNYRKKEETRKNKYGSAVKRASREILRKSRYHGLRKIDSSASPKRRSGIIKPKELSKKTIFHEHRYARPSSNFIENIVRSSRVIRRNEERSLKTHGSVVYNDFNVFRTSNADEVQRYNRKIHNENEESTLANSRDEHSISFHDYSTLEKDTENARNEEKSMEIKTTDGDEKILRKLRPKERRARRKKRLEKLEKTKTAFITRINDAHRPNEQKRKKNLFKLREAISMSKEKKIITKNITINDYDDSDIDEALLVNPSTDLPQLLLDETVNENLDLTNPEFDPSVDLNFSSDEQLSSTFERNIFSSSGNSVAGKLKKLARNNDDNDESRTKKVHFPTNKTRKIDGAIGEKVRRSSEEAIVEVPSLHERNDVEKNAREKRRRSSDDVVIGNKMLVTREENRVNKENEFARVTRLSTRNFVTKESNATTRPIGTVVWGNCMGWWPAFVVSSEDVGTSSREDKTWVCWIGEYRISHLRDRTQIQNFSTNLRERMIDTLRLKTSRDANYVACLETLELVNDEILDLGPLTKPYHVWAERNLLKQQNLDRFVLHPYPSNVQTRLNDLKRKNVRATEKYLLALKNNAEKSTLKMNTSRVEARSDNNAPMPGHLPLIKQKPGVIAWSKIMGQAWWPAVILDYRDWGMKEPSFGCQWIIWYGDNTMSQVNHRFFLSYENGMCLMKEYVKTCKREVYRRGVIDSAKDYCSRYGYKSDDWTMDDIFAWFENVNGKNSLPGIPGNRETRQRYPARIIEILKKHRGTWIVAAAREHSIEESATLKDVFVGKENIDILCLMCLNNCHDDNEKVDHPYFFGKLCKECFDKYLPTIYAYGDDGKCFFCTICAGSDTVVMCDDENCPRVYCTACIKYLVAPNFYNDIMLKDPWSCFICDDDAAAAAAYFMNDGLLKPRDDWKERVTVMFRSNGDSVLCHTENYTKYGKRKIRVLSLFDGISAGIVVLKKLGIQIEAYYASEIDGDAEMISSAHYGDEIVRLGDVRTIDEMKIREILPIDLLIGGSPCNDLSLVNPLRLGLHDPNGTGILVFEYCRVKRLLESVNDERHFFWLFENVASMPCKYRLEINKHLGREPELIDSAHYSPQHRPRLYWGNLPTVSFPLSSQDLQDVLTPNCNRHALVKKIRTVTTRVNSLKQGRDALKPILMNDINDNLWITELEEIFGFPRHYTDVKNLCATKRQKLIAMSWSVQTITEIMRPLCNFFQSRLAGAD